MARWSKKRQELQNNVVDAAMMWARYIPFYDNDGVRRRDWVKQAERVAVELHKAVEKLQAHVKQYGDCSAAMVDDLRARAEKAEAEVEKGTVNHMSGYVKVSLTELFCQVDAGMAAVRNKENVLLGKLLTPESVEETRKLATWATKEDADSRGEAVFVHWDAKMDIPARGVTLYPFVLAKPGSSEG